MTRTARISLIVTVAAVLLVVAVTAVLVVAQRSTVPTAGPDVGTSDIGTSDIAAEARILDAEVTAEVTVTEFLDFECEACGAMHPVVEELRERYDGRVAFTFRYFPLPGHRNSTNAALAVEAAALQDELDPMYRRLFETQGEWGESQGSQAARFRAEAQDLGLDLDRYDADVADPDVLARIERDFALGQTLGIEGTPTFFVDGQVVELQRIDDLEAAIEQALAG